MNIPKLTIQVSLVEAEEFNLYGTVVAGAFTEIALKLIFIAKMPFNNGSSSPQKVHLFNSVGCNVKDLLFIKLSGTGPIPADSSFYSIGRAHLEVNRFNCTSILLNYINCY